MNVLIALSSEEIDCLQDWYADQIGHVTEAECDRVMARIQVLERAKRATLDGSFAAASEDLD